MSETLSILRRKIKGAHDLHSVVRTMKAMAAASIGPYERAVIALADYCRTVELGLVACFRHTPSPGSPRRLSPREESARSFSAPIKAWSDNSTNASPSL